MINIAARLVMNICTFAPHGVKRNDFCCFKGVTYVALCYTVLQTKFLYINYELRDDWNLLRKFDANGNENDYCWEQQWGWEMLHRYGMEWESKIITADL